MIKMLVKILLEEWAYRLDIVYIDDEQHNPLWKILETSKLLNSRVLGVHWRYYLMASVECIQATKLYEAMGGVTPHTRWPMCGERHSGATDPIPTSFTLSTNHRR